MKYIYHPQKCGEVVFQFVKENGYTLKKTIKIPYDEFSERINHLPEFENEGYALISMDNLEMDDLPSASIDAEFKYKIGHPIAIIGYHVDQENLSFKNGIISSFFKTQNGKRFIQFDAALKQGNSGSPLFDIDSGKVIGVVGYRLSAITKSYEAFKNIIDENLKLLKRSEGKFNIMDIDPIQVLIANQNQLKQISKEFYRSANMSFGYAHELHTLSKYLNQINSAKESNTKSDVKI